jgi:predicted RNase H-like nuclease (RuvC/YqgF family)
MKETFYIPHEEDPVLAMCSKAINAATEKLTRELDESNRIISEDSKQILALGEQIQTLTARVKELEEENARLTDFVMKL